MYSICPAMNASILRKRAFPGIAFLILLLAAPEAEAASRNWVDPTGRGLFATIRPPSSAPSSLAVAASGAQRDSLGANSSQTLVFSVAGSASVTDSSGIRLSSVEGYRDPVSGGGINEAHLRISGPSAPDGFYLLVYNFDDQGNALLDPDVTYASFDDFDSSKNLQADISGYVSPDYSLELQLGYYNWETDQFTLMATATAPVMDLAGSYIYAGSSPSPPGLSWTPDFVATENVPEPATGALALVGAALLFRRRRPR